MRRHLLTCLVLHLLALALPLEGRVAVHNDYPEEQGSGEAVQAPNGIEVQDFGGASAGISLEGLGSSSVSSGQIESADTFQDDASCAGFDRTSETVINTDTLKTQLTNGLTRLSGHSNAELARRFWNFITQCQYPGYYATVAVYKGVTGYHWHALIGYDVTYQFRVSGRNYAVYTKRISDSLLPSADQQALLNAVVAANKDQMCNPQANRDRAWNMVNPKGGRFVLVTNKGVNVEGYHSVANTQFATYRCKWSQAKGGAWNYAYEFIYLGF